VIRAQHDYDHEIYDRIWEECVDLGLPVHFHILTSDNDDLSVMYARKTRGPKIAQFMSIIRGVQDIMLMLVFSGVFERHPKLKVVCAEADALGPAFHTDGPCLQAASLLARDGKLSKLPSEYFSNNIYVTFQDDFAATHLTALSPTKRLMWASDFPHNDGTYPHTREVIAKLTDGMSVEDRTRITGANVTELYGLAS
jgi:predicted TIM-barrel fold metal-dependent hydrolase